jgi:hypothetical protein
MIANEAQLVCRPKRTPLRLNPVFRSAAPMALWIAPCSSCFLPSLASSADSVHPWQRGKHLAARSNQRASTMLCGSFVAL